MGNNGTSIARTELLVKAGDSSPFESMLTAALDVSPFTEKNKDKLKTYYQRHPSRYVDDLVKLRNNLPQYGGSQPINTTNNLVLHLGELSLNQKERMLKEKLAELGITEETFESLRVQKATGRSNSNSPECSGREVRRPATEFRGTS